MTQSQTNLSTVRAMHHHLGRAWGILDAHDLQHETAKLRESLEESRMRHRLDFGSDTLDLGGEP